MSDEDWQDFTSGPFPSLVGPYRARREGEGWRYAFAAEERHLNRGGVLHGGAIIAFADECIGATLWELAGRRPLTTVQLNTHFVSPARPGDLIELGVEPLRVTRSLIFVRATLRVGERIVAAFDGVWKILGEK